jgi:PAS domain-containing protein
MFNFLESLNHKLAILSGLAAAMSLLIPKVRGWLVSFFRSAKLFFSTHSILEEIRADLKYVKAEVSLNGGGSIKDSHARLERALNRQESFRKHDFWTKSKPAMELNENGHVLLVSQSLCELLGVSTPEELSRRSWARFIHSDEVDDFLKSFVGAAENNSSFRYEAKLIDIRRREIGTWEFRAHPIEPSVDGKKHYSGYWVQVE